MDPKTLVNGLKSAQPSEKGDNWGYFKVRIHSENATFFDV